MDLKEIFKDIKKYKNQEYICRNNTKLYFK